MPNRERDGIDPRPIDRSHRVVLPPEVMDKLDVEAGDHVAFVIDADGVHLRKVEWQLR